MKATLDQFASSEHAFDINAEPESLPMECGAAGDAADDNDDVDYDGFGPVDDGDNDDDDDSVRGGILICGSYSLVGLSVICSFCMYVSVRS